MKNDKIPENPEGSFDREEWERTKLNFRGAAAIRKGREMGVPEEEIIKFAEENIVRKKENGDYALVYQFRKNMKIGTPEVIRAAGEEAYKFLFEGNDFIAARNIAEEIYGKESEEWRKAEKAYQEESEEIERKKKEISVEDEEDLVVKISKNATFADLKEAIDNLLENHDFDDFHLDSELWDNFDQSLADEFFDALHGKKGIKVIDFFREHGYSKKDITVYLPIKFDK